MTMETQWTHGQWYVTPVARTTHRVADGVIIAVSLQKFSKESIVTHHVWQPRLLGVRVKAGQGGAEVDTYFACGYAPTEVSPAEVREKFWDDVDWMLRSLPKKTRIIMAIALDVSKGPRARADDPKDQISATTEIPAGPFAAVDVVRAVKGLPNFKAGPEHR